MSNWIVIICLHAFLHHLTKFLTQSLMILISLLLVRDSSRSRGSGSRCSCRCVTWLTGLEAVGGPCTWRGTKSNGTNIPPSTIQYKNTLHVQKSPVWSLNLPLCSFFKIALFWGYEQATLSSALIHHGRIVVLRFSLQQVQEVRRRNLPSKCWPQGICRSLGQNLDFPSIWGGIQRIPRSFKPQRTGYFQIVLGLQSPIVDAQ